MAKQTKFDRGLIFFRKVLRTQLAGLRVEALKGRCNGPRVLANSIPKAGTNLMERALMLTPGMRMAPFRTIMDWDGCSARTARRLKRLGKGQFINAHVVADQDILGLVKSQGIKTIFLIRDPRDVLISNFKYVCEIDTTHFSHKVIASLPDDNARLSAAINGIDGVVASVSELWMRFDGWLSAPDTLVVRYEDLIGGQGGGDDVVQLATIKAITSHIGFELSHADIEKIALNVFSTKSPTFRKGQLGTWRQVFSAEHVQQFKEQSGDLLIRLGYESSHNWGGGK
jgi:hypothetical protein